MRPFSKNNAINLFLFYLILFAPITIKAQVGIGTTTPAPSAQLDVSSTTKGFLPPRMTQAQRNAITSPAPGLMIWCSDCGLNGEILVFNGMTWGKIAGGAGKNYYVSAQGNNNNDGLTPLTPWQTIDKVNAQISSMAPGDSILFKRGSYFFGTIVINRSGTSGSPIVFSAYGSGSKPVFIYAKQENQLTDWTNLGGNIYENKDLTFYVDVANLVFNNRASVGKKIMSATPILSSQGDFWYDFVNHKILIYSVGNPATVYSDIQCVLSHNAIEGLENNGYIVFENLDFRYYGRCVLETGGSNCSFRNLDISYIGGGDHHGHEGNPYQSRFGNGLQMWEGVHDVTITGCRIDNVYDAGISPQGIADIPSAVYNLYMRNNVISNCEYSFEFFEWGVNRYIHDIYFENNTCVNAGGGWGHNQRWGILAPGVSGPDPNGTHVRIERVEGTNSNIFIRNNIFYGATERLNWIIYLAHIGNFVLDYNDFYQTPPAPLEQVGSLSNGGGLTNYATLPLWRAAISKEAHSIGDNPLFVSPTDFHLQAGSPVIGKGFDNGYGKDMGAYPYNPGGN